MRGGRSPTGPKIGNWQNPCGPQNKIAMHERTASRLIATPGRADFSLPVALVAALDQSPPTLLPKPHLPQRHRLTPHDVSQGIRHMRPFPILPLINLVAVFLV